MRILLVGLVILSAMEAFAGPVFDCVETQSVQITTLQKETIIKAIFTYKQKVKLPHREAVRTLEIARLDTSSMTFGEQAISVIFQRESAKNLAPLVPNFLPEQEFYFEESTSKFKAKTILSQNKIEKTQVETIAAYIKKVSTAASNLQQYGDVTQIEQNFLLVSQNDSVKDNVVSFLRYFRENPTRFIQRVSVEINCQK